MFGRKPARFNLYSLLTFAIGAVAGAGLALLFAPRTGRQLQKQLKEAIGGQVEIVQNAMKRAVA